jgi:hypothetical protein
MVSFGVKSVFCRASWDVQLAGEGEDLLFAGYTALQDLFAIQGFFRIFFHCRRPFIEK